MSKIIRTGCDSVLSKVVEYHGFIFTQGLVARDLTQDTAGQTRDILAQLDELLQTQIWLKDMNDRAAFNDIWTAWLPEGGAPARACVEAVMANPGFRVEVMVIACK
jgi:enamine deaminase RidA (YjgF/YER057c/UK114 family)